MSANATPSEKADVGNGSKSTAAPLEVTPETVRMSPREIAPSSFGEDVNPPAAPDEATPTVVKMSPREIAPSLFGEDVNPPATPEEALALQTSIAERGVLVPLTVGRLKGMKRPVVVNGTRRLKIALDLKLPDVPVIVRDYDSIEEMKQDALRDNMERRQFTIAGRAAQANSLWESFVSAADKKKTTADSAADKKEMAAKGDSPRKRAAKAGGVSEGTLANYRYVLDSGNASIINDMLSGKLAIDKAHNLAKKEVDGNKGDAGKQNVPARMKRLQSDLDGLTHMLKTLPEITKQAQAVQKTLTMENKSNRSRMEKRMQATVKIIEDVLSNNALGVLCQALNAPKPVPASEGRQDTPDDDIGGKPAEEIPARCRPLGLNLRVPGGNAL